MKIFTWIGTLSFLSIVHVCIHKAKYSEAFQHKLEDLIDNNVINDANHASFQEKYIPYETNKENKMKWGSKISKKYLHHESKDVGTARFMASYFFPIFPQFYDVDLNGIWNFLKDPETIEFIVALVTFNVSY